MLPAIFFRCHNLKFCYGLKLRIVWKATVGLVQQAFGKKAGSVLKWSFVLLFKFSAS